ncbi:hypothetical protein F3Y22_tig00117048pilonHSYRG00404 [Hibiscus syriacus]|uniref:SAM-dependent MTase DRM-type domain-containing protein n=1 Tax=Hibiscus syriacus TaxID=106335 RepID=A0A6A2XCT5_HIBSY|nr:hypothetical protein F3Y22_tig00117048pilonHSYRG00404 [Hibiscus syriacus]
MQHVDSDNYSSDYEAILQDDFTYIDSSSDTEEILNSDSDENKMLYLTKMGYSEAEASIAMKRCCSDSSITELTDFIYAAQMAKAADAILLITQRTLPEDAIGPPYFYYENVALAPVGVWTIMLRYLYDVEPEFVDSKYFCAAARKRSAKLIEKIRKALEAYDNEPPLSVQKHMFPGGINVLSLFSGISDAEVTFYCLGIPLKIDAQELNGDRLEQLLSRFGELNLVVGDIQYNNLTGRNKHHRDEL